MPGRCREAAQSICNPGTLSEPRPGVHIAWESSERRTTVVDSYFHRYIPNPALREDPDAVPRLSIHARTLQKAAQLLGGDRALARYLKVPMPDLFVWMRPGAMSPPENVFLKAVDLVMNDLNDRDAERAQKVRVAAIHSDWSEDKS